MDSDVNLGGTPSKYAKRDAIHVAVIPMVAGESLQPGSHVSIVDGKCFATGNLVGVVDPYLRQPITKGQTFWLCLYPKTIRSLRHVWSCSNIPDEGNTSEDENALIIESERWLRQCAKKMNPYDDEEQAFQNLISGLKNNELSAHGTTLYYLGDLDNPDELKFHAERFLGTKIANWDNFTFSCSC